MHPDDDAEAAAAQSAAENRAKVATAVAALGDILEPALEYTQGLMDRLTAMGMTGEQAGEIAGAQLKLTIDFFARVMMKGTSS